MSDEQKNTNDTENKNLAVNDNTEKSVTTSKPWDEARVVVFLIGICLLVEGLLIYYQAGSSQVLVAGVTGLGGLVMMLMAWLLPFEEDETEDESSSSDNEEESESDSEKTKESSDIPQSKIPTEERPVVADTSEKKEDKPVAEEAEKKKQKAEEAEF